MLGQTCLIINFLSQYNLIQGVKMKYLNQSMQLLILLSISMIANATEVYEKVNKQGVEEFSDQASPGATKVDVHPNVVHTKPPALEDSSSSQPAGPQFNDNKPDMTGWSENDEGRNRYRDEMRHKELIKKEKSTERHEVDHETPRHEVDYETPKHIVH